MVVWNAREEKVDKRENQNRDERRERERERERCGEMKSSVAELPGIGGRQQRKCVEHGNESTARFSQARRTLKRDAAPDKGSVRVRRICGSRVQGKTRSSIEKDGSALAQFSPRGVPLSAAPSQAWHAPWPRTYVCM